MMHAHDMADPAGKSSHDLAKVEGRGGMFKPVDMYLLALQNDALLNCQVWNAVSQEPAYFSADQGRL